MTGVVILALLSADPHSALVMPEKLAALDQTAAKIARDIAKQDRVHHQLDPQLKKLKASPDAGLSKETAEWDEHTQALAALKSELSDDVAAVRAMKESKTGVTVDAARDLADKLDGLAQKVTEQEKRLERLVHSLKQPAK